MRLSLFSLGLAALLANTTSQAATQNLRVYTALETEHLTVYEQAFKKAHPDINIQWVRDSTGVITARLLAEKANPKADVVLGVAASSMALLAAEGMLQPHAAPSLEQLTPAYRDSQQPPRWAGMNAFAATLCFNTVEAAKRNIPTPSSWQDLLDPVYHQQIVMPHPVSSGTGYFALYSWLKLFAKGEQSLGWQYMDALHPNIAQYSHSGSKPCNMAAQGEYVVGISFDYRGLLNQSRGAPIKLIFPQEGLGWDLEAVAIHQGTPNLEAAQKLTNWAVSPQAMQLYARHFPIVANSTQTQDWPQLPGDFANRLIEQNFDQLYQQRDAILNEWSQRYQETKSQGAQL